MADEKKDDKPKAVLWVRDAEGVLYVDHQRELHKNWGPAAVQAYVNRFIDKGTPVAVVWSMLQGQDYRTLDGIGNMREKGTLPGRTYDEKVVREISYGFLPKQEE